MPVEISELRPDDHEEVEALLRASISETEGDDDSHISSALARKHDSILSLVARQEGKIIGAIVCDQKGEYGLIHHLAVDRNKVQEDVIHALMDKALRKLNYKGINKCRVGLPSDTQQHPFWDSFKWTDCPDLATEPLPSSAVTDRLSNYQESDQPDPEQDPGQDPDNQPLDEALPSEDPPREEASSQADQTQEQEPAATDQPQAEALSDTDQPQEEPDPATTSPA